ncbi:MAG: hypothetical protein FD179_1281 [Erysipelotrichaceae bacterium]|nr:MAG: hypothetical protein FD179_1281 [Erysipelotrichaceae bacterium]
MMKKPSFAALKMNQNQSRLDWSKSTFEIQFHAEGAFHSLSLYESSPYAQATLEISEVAFGTRLQIIFQPHGEVQLEEVRCDLNFKVDQKETLFFNGYQSWTDSHELKANDKMPHLSILAKPLMDKYKFDRYGDTVVRSFSHRKGHFHGFTYATVGSDQQKLFFGSLNEKTGFTILEYFHNKGKWSFIKDNAGWIGSEAICVLDMLCLHGSSSEVYDTYFELLGTSKPRIQQASGWTSWYNYYQNISESLIHKNLRNFTKEDHLDFFQIDDGYQTAVGDWLSVDPSKFPQGMKPIADQIHTQGMKAGIWLAPFVAETKSELFRNHPDWFIKDYDGKPLSAGGNWSGCYALDLELLAVRDHLRAVFDVMLNEWDYDMVKLDFLYAACMMPRNNKSRGQLMHEAMSFVRDCVKDKYILGCGVPLASSFGLVDFCRIGCDVGLDWNDRPYMRMLHRERISTLHSIKNSIGRRHLNRRAFVNDPDVFLLRESNIALSLNQKKTLALTNWLFGGLLFTSDDISEYKDQQRKLYQHMMHQAKPIVTTVESSQDLVRIDTVSGEQYLMNLSSKSRKDHSTNQVLAAFESMKVKD